MRQMPNKATLFQIEMSEAEKQKIVVQISSVQTELQRTIDERFFFKSLTILIFL